LPVPPTRQGERPPDLSYCLVLPYIVGLVVLDFVSRSGSDSVTVEGPSILKGNN